MISDELREFYRGHHKEEAHYGTTGYKNAGPDIVRTLERRGQVATVLDFGAGKGTLGAYLTDKLPHLTVTNYDPAIPGIDVLPPGQFDAVVSSDVFEHIEEADMDACIEAVRQKARRVVCLYIACSPTGETLPDGRDLHVSLHEPHEWRERLGKVKGWVEMEYRTSDIRARKTDKRGVYLVYDVVP